MWRKHLFFRNSE